MTPAPCRRGASFDRVGGRVSVRPSLFLATLAVALLLGGCGGGSWFGKQGTGPDEFAVVTRAPLSLPPDYGLRPPRPGAQRPNEETPRQDARQHLLSNTRGKVASSGDTAAGDLTGGESALLKRAGAADADPEIRVLLERESYRIKEDKTLVDTLVFWRDRAPAKTVVDPAAEAQRLRENAALGEPPTKGQTPTVVTK